MSVSERRKTTTAPLTADTPWCYLYTHHMKVPVIEKIVKAEGRFGCFVHRTVTHVYTKGDSRVKKKEAPTICGLIFLHGDTWEIQHFLNERFPALHLVNSLDERRPALIPAKQMNAFMQAATARPDDIMFVRKESDKGRTIVRVLSGPLAGIEGYIVRIRRDRKLVISLGNMAVAIGNVHNERFEEL